METELQDLARAHTKLAIAVLVDIMTNADASASVRLSAAKAMLERGWGEERRAKRVSRSGGPVKATNGPERQRGDAPEQSESARPGAASLRAAKPITQEREERVDERHEPVTHIIRTIVDPKEGELPPESTRPSVDPGRYG